MRSDDLDLSNTANNQKPSEQCAHQPEQELMMLVAMAHTAPLGKVEIVAVLHPQMSKAAPYRTDQEGRRDKGLPAFHL